jgi:hypothetical protein
MAYTVNKTNGGVLATVSDGTIDSSTDIKFIGKNYSGYGELLNENFVKLLENFSNSSAPSAPLAGQIWWDSSNSLLKVYTGSAFKTVSSSTTASSDPASGVVGDLFWHTTNNQLKVYNGSSWTTIGPLSTTGSGQSGPEVVSITDTGSVSHVIVKMFVNDVIVSIISKDAVFTPNSAISGFATIKQGYTVNSTLASAKWNGTATNSDALGGVAASGYLTSGANDVTSGTLKVQNDTGFYVGADDDYRVSVSGSNITLNNNTSDGDIIIQVNDGGTPTTALTVDGATSRVLLAGNPTVNLGAATKQYVDTQVSGGGTLLANGTVALAGDLLPDANNTRDLGSNAKKYNQVFATTFEGQSTSAQYADLAERFAIDSPQEAGTIVALGGAKEITKVNDELSNKVFGVISTRPAYLMNSKAGDNASHPAIAVSGRVPVKVIGTVVKGDRLVSAGNGMARSASTGEANYFNCIGRALEDKNTSEVGEIEAFVIIN